VFLDPAVEALYETLVVKPGWKRVTLAEGPFARYRDQACAHEAGYDAYLTG
jgi:hypothetical protein